METEPTKGPAEMKSFKHHNLTVQSHLIFNTYDSACPLSSPIQNKAFLMELSSRIPPRVPHNIRSMSQAEAGFAGMQTRVFILSPRLQGSWIRRAEYAIRLKKGGWKKKLRSVSRFREVWTPKER